jgi:hypothetical protein
MSSAKQVTCACAGKYLVKVEAKPTQAQGFWARAAGVVSAILRAITGGKIITGTAALKNCPKCGGKGSHPDSSDDSARYAQVAAKAESGAYLDKYIQQTALLAPGGGNEHRIYQGDVTHEIGLDFNDLPSYRIDPGGGARIKGIAGPEDCNPGAPCSVPQPVPANHVQGINPLPLPGGHYFIKCSNKFTLMAGAHGVDITTNGPLTIDAGITKITGPEVTVGSSQGKLVLEGESVTIAGKSIEVAPSDGHFFVKGTISNSGNLIVGGHAHAESLSFVKAECVAKNETSTLSDGTNCKAGAAYWWIIEGLPCVLLDYIVTVADFPADPKKLQALASTRMMSHLIDKIKDFIYIILPYDLPAMITGMDSLQLPIYNYPHVHRVHDSAHTHTTRVPNITLHDNGDALRSAQGGVGSSAPLHKETVNLVGVAAAAEGIKKVIETIKI